MIDPIQYGFEEYHSEKVSQLLMWKMGNIILYPLPDHFEGKNKELQKDAKWVINIVGDAPLALTDMELIQYLRGLKVDQIVKKK